MSPLVCWWTRSFFVVLTLAAAFVDLSVCHLEASVTTVGAVPNVPPAGGGAVVGVFVIGDGAFGSVTVTGGTAITSSGGSVVGNGVGGMGLVSLTGFGSDWTVNNVGADLTLGDEGTGQVMVASQARLAVPDDTLIGSQPDSNGKLTVTGLGSIYDSGDDLLVGRLGIGNVEVLAGGAIEADVSTIGDGAGGQGSVTVSGDLSRWTSSILVVGDAGDGELNVTAGGRLTASSMLSVGVQAEGVGEFVVSGPTSAASSAGSVIGTAGSGRLSVLDGGRYISTSNVNVAQDPSSVGELVVSGPGSRFRVNGLLTTGLGEANLLLADGGVLSSTGEFTFGAPARVELDGGRLESTQALDTAVRISGTLLGSGTIDAQGVTIQSSPRGRLAVEPGDRLHVTGLLANHRLVELNGGELDVAGVVTNDMNANIDARDGAILRVGSTGLENNNGSQLSIAGGQVDVYGAVNNHAGATISVVGGSTGVFHDVLTNSGMITVSASSEIVTLLT